MRLPISVKGIVFENGKVWLRRNERQEWELPGGKLDPDEQPVATVKREMAEELGMHVRPVAPVHAYRHTIPGSSDEAAGVLVISYLCEVLSATGRYELTGEGGTAAFDTFAIDQLGDIPLPGFYREAIMSAQRTATAGHGAADPKAPASAP